MPLFLIGFPLIAAVLSFVAPWTAFRLRMLPLVALIHLSGVIISVAAGTEVRSDASLGLDALGGWILLVVSTLFTLCMCYAPAYLALRPQRSTRVFSLCLLTFISMASLVTHAQHPGLLWVAMEAMTLTTAPLIYYNHNAKSLEATWKYLVIGSVGIAIAFLGTLFMALAAVVGKMPGPLLFANLIAYAPHLSPAWVHAGFVLLLVGYGTKMGLAPLHTWKPDAYGETPGIVGAILAGGVTSCAFLALARMFAVVTATGDAAVARELLTALGFLSMAWAMAFMARQDDFKRLLAYSSVEHMGILAIGLGIGGRATWFALFHVAANALVKCVLFLSAGNIHRAFASKHISATSGAIRRVPVSGWLFILGFIAITGSPPFAVFISEFGIISTAINTGHTLQGMAFLVLLAGIFFGMSRTVLVVTQGEPPSLAAVTSFADSAGTTVPIIIALALALVLGVWLPQPIDALLTAATALVEHQP